MILGAHMNTDSKKAERAVRYLLYAVIPLALAACICVIMLTVRGVRDEIFDSEADSTSFDLSDHKKALGESADHGTSYIDSITFLGDKSIKKLLEFKLLTGGKTSHQVWTGESGDIPLDSSIKDLSVSYPDSGEIHTLTEALTERSPRYIMVTLGISNGVPYCSKEKFTSYYQDVIDIIKSSSPDTVIILQSIFPVSRTYEKSDPTITNKKIDEANFWIAELCEKNDISFLYSAISVKDADGYLAQEYTSEEGIYMNSAGYKRILEYIRTHAYT